MVWICSLRSGLDYSMIHLAWDPIKIWKLPTLHSKAAAAVMIATSRWQLGLVVILVMNWL